MLKQLVAKVSLCTLKDFIVDCNYYGRHSTSKHQFQNHSCFQQSSLLEACSASISSLISLTINRCIFAVVIVVITASTTSTTITTAVVAAATATAKIDYSAQVSTIKV